jgi:Straboviridae intron-associated endonuclease 1
MSGNSIGGIYKITNRLNGKFYIGKSINIKYRFKYHKCPMNFNKYPNSPLYKSAKKYGWDNFELSIIEDIDNIDLLNEREIFWISKLKPEYNCTKGGEGTYGRIVTEEQRRKMSEKIKGRKYSQEHCDNIGKSKNGYRPTEKTLQLRASTRKPFKHSEKARQKISESRKGKKRSEETRRKLSESKKKAIKMINIETGQIIIYSSAIEIAKELGLGRTSIGYRINNNLTIDGFLFKFL